MKFNKEIKTLALVASSILVLSLVIYFVLNNQKSATVNANSHLSTGIANFTEGPLDAKVTVVEFFDPECESCAQVSPYIKNEMAYYKGKVRWVFRYMAYHPSSHFAIQILEAARKQNLYLEAVSLLLGRQSEWGAKHDGTVATPKEKELLTIISSLSGINLKQLQEDMKDPAIEQLIETDKRDGVQAGVTGTPTLFVNDKLIDPFSLDTMIVKINEALK